MASCRWLKFIGLLLIILICPPLYLSWTPRTFIIPAKNSFLPIPSVCSDPKAAGPLKILTFILQPIEGPEVFVNHLPTIWQRFIIWQSRNLWLPHVSASGGKGQGFRASRAMFMLKSSLHKWITQYILKIQHIRCLNSETWFVFSNKCSFWMWHRQNVF